MKEFWPIHLVALVLTALLLADTSDVFSDMHGEWPILDWVLAVPLLYVLAWMFVAFGIFLPLALVAWLVDEIRGDYWDFERSDNSFP